MLRGIVLLSIAVLSTPAIAQEVKDGASPAIQQAISSPAPRVTIAEDQKIGAFRFMIDGQEVARLDATGLHVRESIEYGGTLTDAGTAHFDQHVAQENAQ